MLQMISGRTSDFSAEFDQAVAAYRHSVFIERLGWPLETRDGLERDQFDRPDTVYVVARGIDGAICGCARLLPTTSPYLLSEVFPQLMQGASTPASEDVWELSRFAAMALQSGHSVSAAENTRSLLAAAVCSAARHGARRLITVSPIGIERLLYRLGVHAYRAGPPVRIDGKFLFACWIDIDSQTTAALEVRQDSSVFQFH